MLSKGNKLYSILYSKCPKCHEGDVFESKNPYQIKQFASMPERCSVCNQQIQPEPGFFFGAMYVSYALAVGLGIVMGTPMLIYEAEMMTVIYAISLALIILSPLNFRWSRMIWMNMFIHYSGQEGVEN
jgi:uncharacterized protein (DUF983 family)